MMPHSKAVAVALTMVLASAAVHAQSQRSGGDAQKFMQQYQQIAAEKTALQAQVAQMKSDLDGAQTELAAVKKERDALKKQAGTAAAAATALTSLTAAKQTAEKNLEQYKQRMTELVARFRDLAANLKEVEADRSKIRQDLQERNSAFDKCAADNMQLYEINGEILDRYEHVGLFTKVSSAEPFTRITRSRIDNLVDEYRARALELRVQKQNPPSVPQSVPQ